MNPIKGQGMTEDEADQLRMESMANHIKSLCSPKEQYMLLIEDTDAEGSVKFISNIPDVGSLLLALEDLKEILVELVAEQAQEEPGEDIILQDKKLH